MKKLFTVAHTPVQAVPALLVYQAPFPWRWICFAVCCLEFTSRTEGTSALTAGVGVELPTLRSKHGLLTRGNCSSGPPGCCAWLRVARLLPQAAKLRTTKTRLIVIVTTGFGSFGPNVPVNVKFSRVSLRRLVKDPIKRYQFGQLHFLEYLE